MQNNPALALSVPSNSLGTGRQSWSVLISFHRWAEEAFTELTQRQLQGRSMPLCVCVPLHSHVSVRRVCRQQVWFYYLTYIIPVPKRVPSCFQSDLLLLKPKTDSSDTLNFLRREKLGIKIPYIKGLLTLTSDIPSDSSMQFKLCKPIINGQIPLLEWNGFRIVSQCF